MEEETATEATMVEEKAPPEEQQGRPRHRRAPGRRYVYKRWCKGCGICIAFCPEGVFDWGEDSRAEVIHPEKCTNCQICDRLCPDFAITLTPWEDKYGELFKPTSLGQDKAEGSGESIA